MNYFGNGSNMCYTCGLDEDVEEIDEDKEYNQGWNDCVDHIENHLNISKFMKRG